MRIDLLPAARADDDALLARVAAVVNAAYAIGEAGMWQPGVARVTAAEIGDLARSQQLLAAEHDGRLVGCVRVHAIDAATWGFGMLAVDPDQQRGGVGRALVDAAEERASGASADVMQLELMVPKDRVQESKTRLAAWYAARGYARTGEASLADEYPQLVPLLAVPCTFEIWQKALHD